MDKTYQLLLSNQTKKKIERFILYVALFGFLAHLLIILSINFGLINVDTNQDLLQNPISAIYTPFSFILIYEVYLLIYYLPKSFTTYITKQYEIITLIIIRKLFKDLSGLELTSNWFEIKGDLQFTYDIIASTVLFYLIYLFQKHGKRKEKSNSVEPSKVQQFIQRKKIIAMTLVPIFVGLAAYTLVNWINETTLSVKDVTNFESLNNLFFDEFFTILILVDVVLLIVSLFFTDKFHKIIRNSGFIVSTILIRLSFGVSGLISTVLIISAVVFGLVIILIHNNYEKLEKSATSKNLNS